MNDILREIKLSKLTDTPMSDNATKLTKFWDELWSDMEVYVDNNKGEIGCCKDDGCDYYYFYQHSKDGLLWCNCDKVWSFFRDSLSLEHNEIQKLIQIMVSETLNYKVNIPIEMTYINQIRQSKTKIMW